MKSIEQNHEWYNAKFFEKWAPVYDTVGILIAKLRKEAASKVSNENTRVLDVACGTGAQTLAFANRGLSVVGIDLSHDMLKHARDKVSPKLDLTFIQGDAVKIGYPNDAFDASSISLGLHDMPEDVAIKILNEMIRVTKKDGQIIIADYNTPQNWLGHQFMKLWESQYYQHFLEVGIDHYLDQVELTPISKDVILFNNYQIVVCDNIKTK